MNQNCSLKIIRTTIIRQIKPNHRVKGFSVKLPIAIHPRMNSNRIIINCPGALGSIDGYNDKYLKIAEFIRTKIGTVIRTANHFHSGLDYSLSIQDDLRAVIHYARKHALKICQTKNPDIYLMGFSAGASAIAAVAHEFPAVKKILLIAPSGDAGARFIREGLNKFTGELYITIGENDEVVGQDTALFFAEMAKKTIVNKVVIIPGCNHQFAGQRNGLIMSKAPLWAFLGDNSYPETEGGVVLY